MITIDFLTGSLARRLAKNKGRRELIAKAVGLKAHEKLFIIDATAGLGRDGFLLATLGCKVLMLERAPIIGKLLQEGLQKALADKRFAELDIELLIMDAKDYLNALTKNNYPDVIYLDPMFPERKKSALVKKELRYLREVVGEDKDAANLLAIALTRAKRRVVVKRPRLSTALPGPKPHHAIIGKDTRFDVYC